MGLPPGDDKICRVKGNTYVEQVTIRQNGAALNITGGTVLLTINTLENPPSDATEVTEITGSITDGPNGVVEFTPDATLIAQAAGTYYYEVQLTLSGVITSVMKGPFEIIERLTQ